MRTLYHLALSPACRKVRLVLGEKGLEHRLLAEKVWERREDFLRLNPAGEVPVLVEQNGLAVPGSGVICDHLEETARERPLLPRDAAGRVEVRRLAAWFDDKFNREVTVLLVDEKVMKRIMGQGAPDAGALRAGRANLANHLAYMAFLLDRRDWLAGSEMTLADLAAGAHVSALDYFGDIAWDSWPAIKAWYQRLKSRKAFRPLLADSIPGMPPPAHYADLDF